MVHSRRQDNSEIQLLKVYNRLDEAQRSRLIEYIKSIADDDGIPISIFRSKLSSLEAITRFLRQERKMSIKDISRVLARELSTIYNTYSTAQKKMHGRLDTSDKSIIVPLKIFHDRRYAPLESLVAYLKDDRCMTIRQIREIIAKKDSTIRTVYKRYNDKRK